jgi:hypothetical protein
LEQAPLWAEGVHTPVIFTACKKHVTASTAVGCCRLLLAS